MDFLTIAFALFFVLIPIALSKALHLELEKDTIISTIRSIIQLLIVGYILQFVFDSGSKLFIIAMVIVMLLTATLNARKKGRHIRGITWKIALALTTIEIITQGIMIGFAIIPFTAQYVIPISGMLIGNAMVLIILFLNRFSAEVTAHEQQIELILSLGGTPKQAIHQQLIASIKASLIPIIESQKTIGLVQLPGMMSGQIIGGADPVTAVQFQIVINFGLLTGATLASVILGFLVYPSLFNEQMQRYTS